MVFKKRKDYRVFYSSEIKEIIKKRLNRHIDARVSHQVKKEIKPKDTYPAASTYPDNNRVINCPIIMHDSIRFHGKNNILYCDTPNINLTGTKISFNGDNSVIYLSKNRNNTYAIDISVHSDSTIYIGKNNYFNGKSHFIATERQNIIIGDECLFSFGCWFRTADAHAMYDIASKQRINPSKGILVGDHVWIGQEVMVLKNTQLGSGSIIGARSLIPGKRVHSNSVFAGSPVKHIRDGVFFSRDSIHGFTEDQTIRSMHYESSEWVYKNTKHLLSLTKINAALLEEKNSDKKLVYLQENLAKNSVKNRFFIKKLN